MITETIYLTRVQVHSSIKGSGSKDERVIQTVSNASISVGFDFFGYIIVSFITAVLIL